MLGYTSPKPFSAVQETKSTSCDRQSVKPITPPTFKAFTLKTSQTCQTSLRHGIVLLLPSRFRLLDLGPDIGGLEPEQMHCSGRTGYILESRRSRPETTISNSAIRKARTETETHNRFIDKTSNRVVYFEKQGREVDPSPKPSS